VILKKIYRASMFVQNSLMHLLARREMKMMIFVITENHALNTNAEKTEIMPQIAFFRLQLKNCSGWRKYK